MVLAWAWLPCQAPRDSAWWVSREWSLSHTTSSELVCRKQPQFFLEAQERLSGFPLGLVAVVGSAPTQPPHPFKLPITPWWGVLCHTGLDQVFLHAVAGVLLPRLIFHVVFFLEIMSLVIYGYMYSAGSHCGKGALVGMRCGGAGMWATG